MPTPTLTPLSTGFLSTYKEVTNINRLVAVFQAEVKKGGTGNAAHLQAIQRILEEGEKSGRGRGIFASRAAEVMKLEAFISDFFRKPISAGPVTSPFTAGGLVVDTSPSRWIGKPLDPAAPDLTYSIMEGNGKKGAQGTTLKFAAGRHKLFGKTQTSGDKERAKNGGEISDTRREYEIYERLYKVHPNHPNMAKVWGWASMQSGKVHEEGFVMDRIDGPDGRTFQGLLKAAWDFGMITTAEYWSIIQYIGRVHIEVLDLLHGAGWAHNDIKPENYVVDGRTGEVIVIDLGGAALVGQGVRAATVEYMAPEMRTFEGRADGNSAGTMASDLFSLGASIAHAVEAPTAFHQIVKPNRGLTSSGTSSQNTPMGRIKNQFEYGVKTDYTRQLEKLMNSNPLEREGGAASNSFLYDSIHSGEECKLVMRDISSGLRKQEWEAKWTASIHKKPPSWDTRDSLAAQLTTRMRKFSTDYDNTVRVKENLKLHEAATTITQLEMEKGKLLEMAQFINKCNAYGVDTRDKAQKIKAHAVTCEKSLAFARGLSPTVGKVSVAPVVAQLPMRR